jgi:glyoxylase-like metal-dependent hydrolase (beta-lactamase superfamily II)
VVVAVSLVLMGAALAQTAGSSPGPTIAPEPTPPAPQFLAEGIGLIPGAFMGNRQPDGNTVVFKGTTGLVVLDTGRHRWHRRAILDFAKHEIAPIVAIVNSHWHLDHVSGNQDLKDAYPEAKVYASEAIDGALAGFLRDSAVAASEYLKSPSLPPEVAEDIHNDLATIENGAAIRPDVVLKQSGALTLAGRQMDVHLAENGPTAADIWIYDPATRIAAVGDLVTLPVPFLDTACVIGWKAALAELWGTPFEVLIPGHGQPMTRTEFGQYRAAFDAFSACSNSNRDKMDCAANWAKDAALLLRANGMNSERAKRMAAYYVGDVLRPNCGNSKPCRTRN